MTRACADATEAERKSLLGELCEILRSPDLPDSARLLGLEMAGKLARRAPTEKACQSGLGVMLERIRRRSA